MTAHREDGAIGVVLWLGSVTVAVTVGVVLWFCGAAAVVWWCGLATTDGDVSWRVELPGVGLTYCSRPQRNRQHRGLLVGRPEARPDLKFVRSATAPLPPWTALNV